MDRVKRIEWGRFVLESKLFFILSGVCFLFSLFLLPNESWFWFINIVGFPGCYILLIVLLFNGTYFAVRLVFEGFYLLQNL